MDVKEILRIYPPEECPEYDECCRDSDCKGTDLQCEYCDMYWGYVLGNTGIEKPKNFKLGW